MKYVLDENGNIVVTDGQPTIELDDGSKIAYDAIQARKKISILNHENKNLRTENTGLKETNAAFDGINPEEAKKAIETVANIEKDGDKVEALKTAMKDQYQRSIDKLTEQNKALKADIHQLKVGDRFETTKVLEKTFLTPDLAQKLYGDFYQEDGTAKDRAGNVILSDKNIGEPAGFDESLKKLFDSDPNKDKYLKSSLSGTGSHTTNDSKGGHHQEMTSHDKIKEGLKNLA